MATEALDFSSSTQGFRPAAQAPAHGLVGHLRVHFRLWRRQQRRRHVLALVLAETSNPRLVAEAGCRMPGPSMMDHWAQALLRSR